MARAETRSKVPPGDAVRTDTPSEAPRSRAHSIPAPSEPTPRALTRPSLAPAPALSKGVNFQTFVRSIEEEFGAAAKQDVCTASSGELGKLLRYGALVGSGWYPVTLYAELQALAQRVLHHGPELSRRIGYLNLKRDLSGAYRVLAFLLTPQAIISGTPRMMQHYWRGGKVVVTEARDGMGAAHFSGWHGFDRNVWLDLIGAAEAAIEAAGGENVRSRVVSGGRDGHGDLELELRWTRR